MDNAEEYGVAVRGATKLDGARGKKQVWRPMLEPEVFRKQTYCTEVRVTFLGLFGTPQPFSARGIEPLAPRRYAPDCNAQGRASTNHGTQL